MWQLKKLKFENQYSRGEMSRLWHKLDISCASACPLLGQLPHWLDGYPSFPARLFRRIPSVHFASINDRVIILFWALGVLVNDQTKLFYY
jgi:hypothetical protein